MVDVIEALHDSEINGEIAWFWDNSWNVKLGDPLNGYVAEANLSNLTEAKKWLWTTAILYYPNSVFAKTGGR